MFVSKFQNLLTIKIGDSGALMDLSIAALTDFYRVIRERNFELERLEINVGMPAKYSQLLGINLTSRVQKVFINIKSNAFNFEDLDIRIDAKNSLASSSPQPYKLVSYERKQ